MRTDDDVFVAILPASPAAGLFAEFGLSLAFFVGLIFFAALIVISLSTWRVRIFPDLISLPGIVARPLFSLIARCLIRDPSQLVPSR